jgi:hypothetical protein
MSQAGIDPAAEGSAAGHTDVVVLQALANCDFALNLGNI